MSSLKQLARAAAVGCALAVVACEASRDVFGPNPPLGGEIFIHGYKEGRSGTAGCVAVSNPDIEELYAALPLGTEVEIRP